MAGRIGQWAPDSLTSVLPGVYVGESRQLLPDVLAQLIIRLTVDSRLGLPDMFEITFAAESAAESVAVKFAIGTPVAISAAAPAEPGALTIGEVTALEGDCAGTTTLTVRGYSKDHRLQRATRSRTFVHMTDAEIARKLATEAGLAIGVVTPTETVHDHVAQLNQTDWDFLGTRAAALGFTVAMTHGQFQFRPVPAAGSPAVELDFPTTLRAFSPRVTAGNLCPEYEVRQWDPLAVKVSSERAAAATESAQLTGHEPATLGAMFSTAAPDETEPGPLGPPPSRQARIVTNHPAVAGQAAANAAQEAARGMAGRIAATFAEADGVAIGDPRLVAGGLAGVTGVPSPFAGQWMLSRVQHVFDEDGYHTRFEAGGQQDRSLLGLTTRAAGRSPALTGLVCGIVTNVGDWDGPRHLGRVKVALPWVSPSFETDWAPVVHPGCGPAGGTMFLPEVGDEVLLGFELGDPGRPYVLGGVVNDNSTFALGGPTVKKMGNAASVVRRGIVSPSGAMLAFHDESPPGNDNQPPLAAEIVLGTRGGTLALVLDEVAGSVTLRCDPKPPGSQQEQGRLVIECGAAGTVEVRSGPNGTITVDSGGVLNLTAKDAVRIQSGGQIEIKGDVIKLN